MGKTARRQEKAQEVEYSSFDQIDGRHPLRDVSEDCFVDYPVRIKRGGKVMAFNYALAREIGLIDPEHPDTMNPQLEAKILQTFGIVIINEYDQMNNIRFPQKDIKPNFYMATRYLQLQHPSKRGKTSGDGRSVWNGYVRKGHKIYDISSCGTGATCLSPATHIKKRFFKTGDPSISYGCGNSEIDEGMGTLFFSEIMHRNHIKTERILAVIDYGKNLGITVRVHENLLRPSHLFAHLKQDNWEAAKNLLDYHIAREVRNGNWSDCPKFENKKLQYFLHKQSRLFAEMAAKFEDDYIFCWLDWDGDNIMMDGGVIDYGSIRQFGLYHSEYRYDDHDRYSTSIVEQKAKSRYIVQSFAQLVDFVINKKRRPLRDFANSMALKEFDNHFWHCKLNNLARKIGFNKNQTKHLIKKHGSKLEKFLKAFNYFETCKSGKGVEKVADGINRNAIFCMRDILRELPQLYLSRGEEITPEEFIEIIRSNYALAEDLNISGYRRRKIADFQRHYRDIVSIVAKKDKASEKKVLLEMTMRSSIINKYDRVTGDSITTVVDKVLSQRPKFGADDIYSILREFTEYQNLDPDSKQRCRDKSENSKFMKNIFEIVKEYREGL